MSKKFLDSESGVKSIQYSFDNRTWFTGSAVSVDENKTVYFKVTDNAGNVTEKSVVVSNIDKIAPGKPVASADITAVTNQDVTVSTTFSNDTVVKEYSFDNKNWKSYTSGIKFEQNGIVYFRGTDEAGNISEVTTYQVTNIDKVAPTFDVSRNTEALTNQNVILNVAAEDNASGIKSVKYSFDNSSWISGSTVNVDSNKTVYFKVTDNAGNVTEKSVVVSNIDKIAPDKPAASANITTVTNRDVTVSAAFSNDSVIREYSFDCKTWLTYTTGIVMENNGSVYFRGQDAAGNWSDVTTYQVTNIDRSGPDAPVIYASTRTAQIGLFICTGILLAFDGARQIFV